MKVVAATGPAQMFYGMAIPGVEEPVAFFHFADDGELIANAERQLCKLAGYHYGGLLDRATFQKRAVDEIYVSHRLEPEDDRIMSMFPYAKRIPMVDGVLMGRAGRVRNYIIPVPEGLAFAMKQHFYDVKPYKIKPLADKLAGTEVYKTWASMFGDDEYTVVLMQNLTRSWTETYGQEFMIYKRIVDMELGASSNRIIVKPHPRDSQKKVDEFSKKFKGDDRVTVIRQTALGIQPVELLCSALNVTKAVGVATTALATLSEWVIERSMCVSGRMPKELYNEVYRIALNSKIDVNGV